MGMHRSGTHFTENFYDVLQIVKLFHMIKSNVPLSLAVPSFVYN